MLDVDLAETACRLVVTDGSTSHLAADLSRNAGELWVGGERGEVLHGLYQWSRGYPTPVPVLLREISIQSLEKKKIYSYITQPYSYKLLRLTPPPPSS